MGDPFESILINCAIPPNLEASLRRAAFIGEHCIFSPCDHFGNTAPADAPPPISLSEGHWPPASPMLEEDDLMAFPSSHEPSSSSPAARPVDDLGILIKLLTENPDRILGRRDVLEIAESRGIFFAPPSWWRLGGYKQEPLRPDFSFEGEEGIVLGEALDLVFDE